MVIKVLATVTLVKVQKFRTVEDEGNDQVMSVETNSNYIW